MLQPSCLCPPGAAPLLTACLIVRDSAHTLPACLASVAPWVDELVVVDTGSLDHTPQIAAEFGARVFHFPWCDDFSAARNESLRHARGQWLLWIDADDTLDSHSGANLRTHLAGPQRLETLGFVMQVHCPAPSAGGAPQVTVVDHIKLIRNLPGLVFEGRIHEQLLPAIQRQGGQVEWTQWFVVHSGVDHSAAAWARKHERDLRILHLDLSERPGHPFVLFNLGMTYADANDHGAAVNWLRQCLAASAPHESHVRKAYALLMGSLMQEGRFEAARAVCVRGRELFPADVELAFRAGLLAHEMGELVAAEQAYRTALEPPLETCFGSVDTALGGYKARHNLALVYMASGRHALAELQWWHTLAEAPEFAAARRGLVEALLAQHKLATAAAQLEFWYAAPEASSLAAQLWAMWLEASGQHGAAGELLGRAAAAFPPDAALCELQC